MFGLGMPEIILILAVALIVIGPKKLPELAKTLGRTLGEFRKAASDLKDSLIVDPEPSEEKPVFKYPGNTDPSSQKPSPEEKPATDSPSSQGKDKATAPTQNATEPNPHA